MVCVLAYVARSLALHTQRVALSVPRTYAWIGSEGPYPARGLCRVLDYAFLIESGTWRLEPA